MIDSENIHRDNIIQKEQVTFMTIYVYTYIYVKIINKNNSVDLKESKEGSTGDSREDRERRNEVMVLESENFQEIIKIMKIDNYCSI